jgi:hypothetical protein
VQYWRSFEHLTVTPARDLQGARRRVQAIYGNMPRLGLANAGGHVPLTANGRSAARRIGASAEDVPAVAYPGD